ncbi:glycosyltransferase [Vibrio alfacsensis]|uniref:glycosyltransferase n=1 Tax=Vibrio alfacsensis TaxID=1074311 RepID=UPI0040693258
MNNNGRKIHVCHLVFSFDIGGLERVIANCISNLDEDKYEHSIIALTEIGNFISVIDTSVSTYSLKKRKGNDLSIHLKLYGLLKKIKPDILHSYNLSTIEYHWIATLLGIKVRVHAEHGRDSFDVDGSVRKYLWLRRLMSPFIHKFVMVSQDLYDWGKRSVRIQESKLKLIPNGVDTDYFNPTQSASSSYRATPYEGKFLFGHVSRLHPIKDQKFLLDSFEQACLSSPDFNKHCMLIIVGDGPDKETLATKVNKSSTIRGKVIFLGAKTNVKEYYQLFDVFTMTSLAEGIPLTLLESMSMEVPHLVTSVGGIKEVVLKDVTGISLDDDMKSTYPMQMVSLFENRENLKEMAISARHRIKESYSQKSMVSAYDKIYQEVLE